MFLSRLFDPQRNSQEKSGNRRTKKAFLRSDARFWYYWGQWRARRDQWGYPAIWEPGSRVAVDAARSVIMSEEAGN